MCGGGDIEDDDSIERDPANSNLGVTQPASNLHIWRFTIHRPTDKLFLTYVCDLQCYHYFVLVCILGITPLASQQLECVFVRYQ